MPTRPEEFDSLMKQVRLGDTHALARLVRCYENEVLQAARCMLGRTLRSYLDPHDLLQSVHRTLLVGLRDNHFEIPNREKLLALAVTLTRNKIVQHARHQQCQQRHQAALAETAVLDVTRTVATAPPSDPVRDAAYNDMLEKLRETLNETDRQLVELRLEGYTTSEIAHRLNINADVLRVRLSRLRRHLRENDLLGEWI